MTPPRRSPLKALKAGASQYRSKEFIAPQPVAWIEGQIIRNIDLCRFLFVNYPGYFEVLQFNPPSKGKAQAQWRDTEIRERLQQCAEKREKLLVKLNQNLTETFRLHRMLEKNCLGGRQEGLVFEPLPPEPHLADLVAPLAPLAAVNVR